MLNLTRSVVALVADYNKEQAQIKASKAETKQAAIQAAPVYDKSYSGLRKESSDSNWIISINKRPLGCALLRVEHKKYGVHASKTVRVPKQFICVAAALENRYYNDVLDSLMSEAMLYAFENN